MGTRRCWRRHARSVQFLVQRFDGNGVRADGLADGIFADTARHWLRWRRGDLYGRRTGGRVRGLQVYGGAHAFRSPLKSEDYRTKAIWPISLPLRQNGTAEIIFLGGRRRWRAPAARRASQLERGREVVIENDMRRACLRKLGRLHQVKDFRTEREANRPPDRRGRSDVGLPMEGVVGAGLLARVLLMVLKWSPECIARPGPHEG